MRMGKMGKNKYLCQSKAWLLRRNDCDISVFIVIFFAVLGANTRLYSPWIWHMKTIARHISNAWLLFLCTPNETLLCNRIQYTPAALTQIRMVFCQHNPYPCKVHYVGQLEIRQQHNSHLLKRYFVFVHVCLWGRRNTRFAYHKKYFSRKS